MMEGIDNSNNICTPVLAFIKKGVMAHNSAKWLWGEGIDKEGVRNQYIFITRIFLTVIAATILIFGAFTPLSPIVVVIAASWIGINVASIILKIATEKIFKDQSEATE